MSRRKQSNPRPVKVIEDEDEDSDMEIYSNLPTSSVEALVDESSNDTSGKSRLASKSFGMCKASDVSNTAQNDSLKRPFPNTDDAVSSEQDTSKKTRKGPEQVIPEIKNGIEVYTCPVCSTKVKTSQELTSHIRLHNSPTASGYKPLAYDFKCQVCGRLMSSQSSLDRHSLVHSGERPFSCDVCPASFTTNGNLSRHLRMHSFKQRTASPNKLKKQASPHVKSASVISQSMASVAKVQSTVSTKASSKRSPVSLLPKQVPSSAAVQQKSIILTAQRLPVPTSVTPVTMRQRQATSLLTGITATQRVQSGPARPRMALVRASAPANATQVKGFIRVPGSLPIMIVNQVTPQKSSPAKEEATSAKASTKNRRASGDNDDDWDPSMSEESLSRRQRLRRYWRVKQRENKKAGDVPLKSPVVKKPTSSGHSAVTPLGRTRSSPRPKSREFVNRETVSAKERRLRKRHTSSSSVRGIKRELGADSDSRDSASPIINKQLATVNEYHLGKVSPSKRQLQRQAAAKLDFMKKAELQMEETPLPYHDPLLPFQCPVCNKTFLSQFGLDSHLVSHPNTAIRCLECRLTFRTPRGLNMHKYMVHNTQKPDTPTTEGADQANGLLSPQGFSDLNFMDFSSRKFPFVAKTWCEKNSRKSSSVYHQFHCVRCQKSFPCVSAYELHSHKTKTSCSVCGLDFMTNAAMKCHQLSHPPSSVVNTAGDNIEKDQFLSVLSLQSSELKLDKENAEEHSRKRMKQDNNYFTKLDENNPERNNVTVNLFQGQNTVALIPVSVNSGGVLGPRVEKSVLLLATPVPGYKTPCLVYTKPSAVATAVPAHGDTLPKPVAPAEKANIPTIRETCTPLKSAVKPSDIQYTTDLSDINTILQVASTSGGIPPFSTDGPVSRGPATSLTASHATCPPETWKPGMVLQKSSAMNKCPICHQMFEKIKEHMESHVVSYQCCYCDFTTQKSIMMTNHLKMRHAYKPYECTKCGEAFHTRQKCDRHFRFHHADHFKNTLITFTFRPKMHSPGGDATPTVCRTCGLASKTVLSHKQHLSECGRLYFACSSCDAIFRMAEICRKHYMTQHTSCVAIDSYSAMRVMRGPPSGPQLVSSILKNLEVKPVYAAGVSTEKSTLSKCNDSSKDKKLDMCPPDAPSVGLDSGTASLGKKKTLTRLSPKKRKKVLSRKRRRKQELPHCNKRGISCSPADYDNFKDPNTGHYKCPECSKQFKLAAVLRFHRKFHSPSKKRECAKSPGNSFGSDSSGDLASVSRLLSTVNSLTSSLTPFLDDSNDSVLQKVEVPTPQNIDAKNSECPECKQKFDNSAAMINHALNRHMLIVGTSNKVKSSVYKCEYCTTETTYSLPANLFAHLQKEHSDTIKNLANTTSADGEPTLMEGLGLRLVEHAVKNRFLCTGYECNEERVQVDTKDIKTEAFDDSTVPDTDEDTKGE